MIKAVTSVVKIPMIKVVAKPLIGPVPTDKRVCKDDNLLVHKGLFRPGAKPSDIEEGSEGTAQATAQVIRTVKRKYYKVRSGDTLSEIASRNDTTISKLCQLNGIRPTTTIQIGRSLRVR